MIDEAATSADSSKPAENGSKKIVVGVCAMERKAQSKPMKAIIAKVLEFYKDWLTFVIFPEHVILNDPVEDWPLCDCLISFHATGFPLHKAIEYERLRRPYVINDLHRQYDLLDRRKVFRSLARAGIDHPRHCVLIRNEEGKVIGGDLKEYNDSIEVNGMAFNKPFVEKPISAEDHNVFLYFPSSVGSGSQQIFRKVNDRSSKYSTVSTVRREGSYIYEEFIPADGTDVKVYAVGPYYAHAEARKAPGLDGKVERDAGGKEIRYPVILSAKEKMIARRVVIAFGQTVCGFDLLRANGKSYVIDVNGFSFVKTSTKYYEDTAKILGNTILRRLATSLSIPWHVPFQADDPPLVSTQSGKIMELRCVLAVIRHGDRTPKQKIKIIVNDIRFFNLFKKYEGIQKREIKLKRPAQLMEILELIRAILNEKLKLQTEHSQKLSQFNKNDDQYKELNSDLTKINEQIKTWDQMRTVLEMYGHFSGINRKVQLKYLRPKEIEMSEDDSVPELLLILKWGGELTTAGHLQAEALGKLFRTLYPGIRRTDGKSSAEEDSQGLGFLRLHSTYRHDLKIYASDEGRVQMTAAAFAKGLLALEGELTPILMQMVKSANTDGLLNDDYNARQFQNELKTYLHSILQTDRDFSKEDYESLNPSNLRSINNAMEFIKNPRQMCIEIAGYVQRMCEIICHHKTNNHHRTLYLNESWELAERRWQKELREFKRTNKSSSDLSGFDISKIPDIYDNIKYDLEHNPELAINNENMFERFYLCVKNMADIVVPQEYGISEESKICVAQRVCTPLLTKIKSDLHRCVQNPEDEAESLTRLDPRASENIATPMRHVRTRLYFTSESHIHTLMNLLRFGKLFDADDKRWNRALNFLSGCTEFNYMTQIVLMVYESNSKECDQSSLERFHIEVLFSPGLFPCFLTEKERIYEKRFNTHKNKTPQPFNGKTSKSTKSSFDQIEKDGTDGEQSNLPAASSSKSSEGSNLICSEDLATTPIYERTLLSSKQPSPITSRNSPGSSSQPLSKQQSSHEEETHDSDDDELADHSVNLVVLGEVAGKKFSEMAKSTQSEQINRKRFPTPELKSVLEEDLEQSWQKSMKNVSKRSSTQNESMSRIVERRALKIDTSLQRAKHPNTIVKSMSDILSNRSHLCPDESLIAPIDEDLLESPDSGLILDANQATVGSGQGQWAKDILNDSKSSPNALAKENEGGSVVPVPSKPQQSNDGKSYQRPLLATIFSRNSESSETKHSDLVAEECAELPSLCSDEGGGQMASQNLRDDESAGGNSTRRSRFPYRFKHHTVNLLTDGSNVENRLISTAVLMDTTRRKIANNPAVLSTAVIARSSSAPRLQTFDLQTEIKRFWPPLRSLEALCNISFKQFDQFLERMLTTNTPLPSPPKTPVLREIETEHNLDRRLKDTIKRLNMIETGEKKSNDRKS